MSFLHTDITSPIQELWKESYIATQEIEISAGIIIEDSFKDITNFFVIIGMVLYMLFAHRRIIEGLKIVCNAFVNQKLLLSIENQSNMQICRNTLFLFLTICCSFVFANIAYATKIIGYNYTVPIKFVGILVAFGIFFLLRKIALNILAWINRESVFKLIHRISLTYTCIWYIVILCCFFVIKSIPAAPMASMRYCIIFNTLAIGVFYFFQLFRFFSLKGFSHFFYILYLCTLEILPVIVLMHLNFN